MAEAALEAAEWLHVAYRTPLDSELRASMMTHLIKYLLFMRGQIPWCVLLALVFGSSLLSPREAVIVDFDSEMESKEEEAGSLPQQLPTADSPTTDEENASAEEMERPPPSPATSKEKLVHLCAQKLIRALLTLSMESFSR
ncbi:hypothetical protein BBJ28_00010154 [Nothophytophthora sp. Chile5]|nr:hypothetical protein BBJ28_00010154 [Nothophytophthora sp. Chile5]